MSHSPVLSPMVLIKSAGEMASAIACRLYRAGIRRICMLDLDNPLCVRREVSFCTALESGSAQVEEVHAIAASGREGIEAAWVDRKIAVVRTGDWPHVTGLAPDIVIDAILAKRNLGTSRTDAPLVIALGPGFEVGKDCDLIIETNRGHNLGRILDSGCAEANTSIPGDIAGYTRERVLRAPAAGVFQTDLQIGDLVQKGQEVGRVDGEPVVSMIDGILRGLIRNLTRVRQGLKLGDVDPRGEREFCFTISDKARAISGSVLEGVMRHCNRKGAVDEARGRSGVGRGAPRVPHRLRRQDDADVRGCQ